MHLILTYVRPFRIAMVKLAAACVLLVSTVGCWSRPRISPEIESAPPRSVALLPLETESDIPRERLDFFSRELGSQLRNAGFILLDPTIVRRVCSTPGCPRREELFSRYMVDGIVELKIDSIARNNFLAGYYNSISGTFTISNSEKKELFFLDHSVSERGGLLFNTGQLIQGIISQVKNSGDSAEDALASRFINTAVAKIPSPKELPQNVDATAVAITSVTTTRLRDLVYQICADATPDSTASLLINGRKTNLREIRPGRYCGVYFLDQIPSESAVTLDLRSPYGNSVQSEVALEPTMLCKLDESAKVLREKSGVKLLFPCDNGGDNRIIVYRAPRRSGPYVKAGEISSASWTDPLKASSSESYVYAVVSKNSRGERSLPHALSR